ncbi:MAG: response regulator transcription factor [Eubacteriales bacterium]|nr:response regulator transcription factor [Eubacteriales bacterium]
MTYRILVCDDDPSIAEAIAIYLRAEGYDAVLAHDGIEALQICRMQDIHLIIMDIMMPKLDGVQATQRLRETRNVPIIMLSAKGEDIDKIQGLTAGADDYVTKPFSPPELMARVRSQLRRYTALGGLPREEEAQVYRTGALVIDDCAKTVSVDGEEIRVTPVEYGILCFLTKNAGQVFSIPQIYEAVWNEPSYRSENTVAVHIRRIREKIEINPKEPKYLKVVWGIGYKMEKIHEKQLD